MPINDPIKNRKVAPASLAFENGKFRGGATFLVGDANPQVTYQETVNYYLGDTNQLYITNQYVEANTDKVMKAMGEAEDRAKHWAADYRRVFEWDLTQTQYYTFNTWSIVSFNNEVLRAVGCSSTGTGYNARWVYKVPDGAEGTYWVYSHMNLRLGTGSAVTSGHLGIFINNELYRIVDQVDDYMMGSNKIVDLRVQGGCHVPLNTGDLLTIKIRLDDGVGASSSLYPTSVYSYVTGHREMCDTTIYNTPSTGDGYTFNKDA